MPTTYITQAYPVDAFNLGSGVTLTAEEITIVDVNDDGLIGIGDTVNGFTISANYIGDRISLQGEPAPNDVIDGTTFYLSGTGQRYFISLEGNPLVDGTSAGSTWVNNGAQTFPVGSLGPPCLVAGTLVLTPDGEIPVEDLRVGDLVVTLDNGPKPVRWVGSTTVSGKGKHAPIRFAKGSYGTNRPLHVSPQHRILVRDGRYSLLFETDEVLIAAKHLVNGRDVTVEERDVVTYVHVMFDEHEIILAEGAATESFHPGTLGINGFGRETRDELLEIFPQLADGSAAGFDLARPVMRAFEGRLIAATPDLHTADL